MPRKIFLNIPVKDLPRSIAFFEALGYSFEPRFTDEKAGCLVIAPQSIYVMLLTEPFFDGFTAQGRCDTSKFSECIISLDCDSRAEVDEIVRKAVKGGATTVNEPEDHGFMYEHGFKDLDGHLWSYFFMDETAIPNS